MLGKNFRYILIATFLALLVATFISSHESELNFNLDKKNNNANPAKTTIKKTITNKSNAAKGSIKAQISTQVKTPKIKVSASKMSSVSATLAKAKISLETIGQTGSSMIKLGKTTITTNGGKIGASMVIDGRIPTISNAMLPSGMFPSGTIPSKFPSGIIHSGTLPSKFPSGLIPSGTLPSKFPSGIIPSGTLPSKFPSGMIPSGTFPSGMIPSGTFPSGTFPSGMITTEMKVNPSFLPTKSMGHQRILQSGSNIGGMDENSDFSLDSHQSLSRLPKKQQYPQHIQMKLDMGVLEGNVTNSINTTTVQGGYSVNIKQKQNRRLIIL